jgi:hypothetical protein
VVAFTQTFEFNVATKTARVIIEGASKGAHNTLGHAGVQGLKAAGVEPLGPNGHYTWQQISTYLQTTFGYTGGTYRIGSHFDFVGVSEEVIRRLPNLRIVGEAPIPSVPGVPTHLMPFEMVDATWGGLFREYLNYHASDLQGLATALSLGFLGYLGFTAYRWGWPKYQAWKAKKAARNIKEEEERRKQAFVQDTVVSLAKTQLALPAPGAGNRFDILRPDFPLAEPKPVAVSPRKPRAIPPTERQGSGKVYVTPLPEGEAPAPTAAPVKPAALTPVESPNLKTALHNAMAKEFPAAAPILPALDFTPRPALSTEDLLRLVAPEPRAPRAREPANVKALPVPARTPAVPTPALTLDPAGRPAELRIQKEQALSIAIALRHVASNLSKAVDHVAQTKERVARREAVMADVQAGLAERARLQQQKQAARIERRSPPLKTFLERKAHRVAAKEQARQEKKNREDLRIALALIAGENHRAQLKDALAEIVDAEYAAAVQQYLSQKSPSLTPEPQPSTLALRIRAQIAFVVAQEAARRPDPITVAQFASVALPAAGMPALPTGQEVADEQVRAGATALPNFLKTQAYLQARDKVITALLDVLIQHRHRLAQRAALLEEVQLEIEARAKRDEAKQVERTRAALNERSNPRGRTKEQRMAAYEAARTAAEQRSTAFASAAFTAFAVMREEAALALEALIDAEYEASALRSLQQTAEARKPLPPVQSNARAALLWIQSVTALAVASALPHFARAFYLLEKQSRQKAEPEVVPAAEPASEQPFFPGFQPMAAASPLQASRLFGGKSGDPELELARLLVLTDDVYRRLNALPLENPDSDELRRLRTILAGVESAARFSGVAERPELKSRLLMTSSILASRAEVVAHKGLSTWLFNVTGPHAALMSPDLYKRWEKNLVDARQWMEWMGVSHLPTLQADLERAKNALSAALADRRYLLRRESARRLEEAEISRASLQTFLLKLVEKPAEALTDPLWARLLELIPELKDRRFTPSIERFLFHVQKAMAGADIKPAGPTRPVLFEGREVPQGADGTASFGIGSVRVRIHTPTGDLFINDEPTPSTNLYRPGGRLFLFGTDRAGNEVVLPEDAFISPQHGAIVVHDTHIELQRRPEAMNLELLPVAPTPPPAPAMARTQTVVVDLPSLILGSGASVRVLFPAGGRAEGYWQGEPITIAHEGSEFLISRNGHAPHVISDKGGSIVFVVPGQFDLILRARGQELDIENRLDAPVALQSAKAVADLRAVGSIGVNVTKPTFAAMKARKLQLATDLGYQTPFPSLAQVHASDVLTETETALMRDLFEKLLQSSQVKQNLKDALLADGWAADRALATLRILRDGLLDAPQNGLSPDERKRLYEILLIKAKIWRAPSGQLTSLNDFIELSSGLKQDYFGDSPAGNQAIFFEATNEAFAERVIAIHKVDLRLRGEILSADAEALMRKDFGSGQIGGLHTSMVNRDGTKGSAIIVNLAVDGFGKVLSSLFHEMTHAFIARKATFLAATPDYNYFQEGLAEDFAVFALNRLAELYDDNAAFKLIAARRLSRTFFQKDQPQDYAYHYGFLLVESIRQRVGIKEFRKQIVPALIAGVEGKQTFEQIAALADLISKFTGSVSVVFKTPVIRPVYVGGELAAADNAGIVRLKVGESVVTIDTIRGLVSNNRGPSALSLLDHEGETFTFGSAAGAQMQIPDDPYVSRTHGEIIVQPDRFQIVVKSANGIQIIPPADPMSLSKLHPAVMSSALGLTINGEFRLAWKSIVATFNRFLGRSRNESVLLSTEQLLSAYLAKHEPTARVEIVDRTKKRWAQSGGIEVLQTATGRLYRVAVNPHADHDLAQYVAIHELTHIVMRPQLEADYQKWQAYFGLAFGAWFVRNFIEEKLVTRGSAAFIRENQTLVNQAVTQAAARARAAQTGNEMDALASQSPLSELVNALPEAANPAEIRRRMQDNRKALVRRLVNSAA